MRSLSPITSCEVIDMWNIFDISRKRLPEILDDMSELWLLSLFEQQWLTWHTGLMLMKMMAPIYASMSFSSSIKFIPRRQFKKIIYLFLIDSLHFETIATRICHRRRDQILQELQPQELHEITQGQLVNAEMFRRSHST